MTTECAHSGDALQQRLSSQDSMTPLADAQQGDRGDGIGTWSRTVERGIPLRVFGWHSAATVGKDGQHGGGRFGWRSTKRPR